MDGMDFPASHRVNDVSGCTSCSAGVSSAFLVVQPQPRQQLPPGITERQLGILHRNRKEGERKSFDRKKRINLLSCQKVRLSLTLLWHGLLTEPLRTTAGLHGSSTGGGFSNPPFCRWICASKNSSHKDTKAQRTHPSAFSVFLWLCVKNDLPCGLTNSGLLDCCTLPLTFDSPLPAALAAAGPYPGCTDCPIARSVPRRTSSAA